MIEIRDLSRRFGSNLALSAASLRVEAGEIVALLGPNGAGKTTASRIIGGILAPTSGDAIVAGISVREHPGQVRARCGLVPDSPGLYERMTLRRYLRFFASLFDVASPDGRIAELAELLGLTPVLDRRLGAYSRGMKQKAAIARALLHDPPVLLLDEPATALDPQMTQTLRDLIISLRAQHRAILLCTHDLDEAQRIADRVVIVDRGRIVREGPTAQLRRTARPAFSVIVSGDGAAARRALEAAGIAVDSTSAEDGHQTLRWTTDDAPRTNTLALRALLDEGLQVVSLRPEERSLEEAYLAIIAESRA
ncbi:MAG: ABC transporter ATP-binding protein [Candidatus Limnocylindria bacterium]